jgi:WD40 repeat protein
MRTVRIFISSPADVQEERQKARQVVEQLQRRYNGRLKLVPLLWEELPLQADMSFQQGIDLVLSDEQGVDIAVFILWSRLGSPLGALVRKTDGSLYRSGTEREFDLMVQAREQSGGRKPALLAYVRQDEAGFKRIMSDRALPDLESLLHQRKLVDQFIQERFHDAASGANVRAYHTFQEPVAFATRLREHLRQKLDEFLPEQARPETPWEAEPFRGLEVFELEHHRIFFGREQAVCDLQVALREQAAAGNAFVLIVGASGSGKSSLARAGVLSAFVHENLDPAVSAWRWGILLPGAHAQDLCLGLARTLAADQALPELREDDPSLGELAEALAKSPEMAFKLRIKGAFKRASRGGQGEVRFLLLVDQLEELFTHSEVTPAAITAFLVALQALARSGAVWILATVRSDFYARCQAFPVLTALKEGKGSYDLLAPGPAELQRIITEPVWLAGLRYERKADTGETLDQRILNDAVKHPEALPLLEYLLRELYQRRSAEGVLTFAEYERLGGVEGALGTRAEAVFAGLAPDAQLALPEVLNALVTVSEEDENAVVRQRAPMESLTDTPGKRALVDEFLRQRLFIADQGAGGTPDVHVAHEALLRGWGRARQWAAENRDFLRARRRVAQAQVRWLAEGRADDFLLPEGKPLAEAEALLRSREAWVPVEVRDYIRLSARHWEARQERQVRRLRLAVAGFAVLALAALAGGWLAWRQRGVAWEQKTWAEAASKLAQEQRAQAVEALTQMELQRAEDLFTADEPQRAVAHLARMLTSDRSNRVAAERIMFALISRSFGLPLVDRLWHEGAVYSAQFSPEGMRVVTASADLTARVWDVRTGLPLTDPLPHWGRVESAQFSPDGRWVVTASDNKTAQVWDAQTGSRLTGPLRHDSAVHDAQFSPDGLWVVTASDDNTARVWDAKTGKPLAEPLRHEGAVRCARFCIDGRRVATAASDKTARVWDVQTSKPLTEPLRHEGTVQFVQFSPEGLRVLTASSDKTARVWNAQTGKPLTEPLRHEGAVLSARFSSDGLRVVTASADETARVWDAETGKPLTEPLRHKGAVRSVDLSPDGLRLVTASVDETARVWDVRTGKPLTEPLRHDGAVHSVHFSGDGRRLVTASADKTARVWDAQAGAQFALPLRHGGTVQSVQFSPEGRRIVTASVDMKARVWDARTGKPLTERLLHKQSVTFAQFSPEGLRVVTASEDETARVWDAQTGMPLTAPLRHEGAVWSARFSPNGLRVVTACGQVGSKLGNVHVWDAQSGKPLIEPLRHERPVSSAQFSPDGLRIVTASGWTARVWDAETGKPLTGTLWSYRLIRFVQFSPDGLRVVTACDDDIAQVWDAKTGKRFPEMLRHEQSVVCAQFSPDGLRVVTASSDKTARVWDAETGKPLTEPLRHGGAVWSAQFSPDGLRVVTASSDKTARVWDAQSGKPLAEPLRHEGAVWSAQFSPDGQQVVTASSDKKARVWDMSLCSGPVPLWLPELAVAVAGKRLSRTGVLDPVAPGEFLSLRKRLSTTPATNSYTRWARWMCSDRGTRTISPLSKVTVPEYVELRIDENTLESLREAVLLSPTNGLAFARLARAAAAQDPGENPRRLAEADFYSRHAVKLSPNETEVLRIRGEVEHLANGTNKP